MRRGSLVLVGVASSAKVVAERIVGAGAVLGAWS